MVTIQLYKAEWCGVNLSEHDPIISTTPTCGEHHAATGLMYSETYRTSQRLTVEAPDGWHVAESRSGNLEVYDHAGQHVEVTDYRGDCVIVVAKDRTHKLQVVAEESVCPEDES